ncbi:MAG: hypothetical protein ACE5GO_04920 [Anaerolineales bacterium]
MTPLHRTLTQIRALIFTQRAARLLLRAAWTGLAGCLIGWGVYTLFGVPENTAYWIVLGAVFAAPSLLAIFHPLRMARLVWEMDRRLGLREQVSAAWQVSRDERGKSRIASRLIEDVVTLLPGQRSRILRRGWFLGRDLESALIIITLLVTILWFGAFNVTLALPESAPLELPPLDQPPTSEDVFPSGIPGVTNPPEADQAGNDAAPGADASPGEIGTLDNILTGLGEALSGHPETAEAGEALQQGDLEGAAAAIERIADQVDLLPEDARQNAQQALRKAAQQAREAGQDELAGTLERAAQALQNPNSTVTANALDELANELRELGEVFAAMGQPGDDDPGDSPPDNSPQVGSSEGGSGASAGADSGKPEPLIRLEGEGEEFEVEGGDEPSGLLTPGEPSGEVAPPTGGIPSVAGGGSPGDTGIINSILTPYSFPWRWRDVVSDYFSPPR